MTRVGWLADKGEVVGGAELTQAEFRAAAPAGVEVVDCSPGDVVPDLDRYVIQNCVQYTLDDLLGLPDGPRIIKYHHDVGPHLQPGVRRWLDNEAVVICCSPLQAQVMELDHVAEYIPPPVDLQRFEQAALRVNGDRRGSVSVGSWRNYGKAPHRAAEWGAANGGVDFYGSGPFAPGSSREVPYESMPDLLASYERLVFLPSVLEPFGRVVAEAWAAGCEIVTNDLVGAKWWIEHNPEGLETAAVDFWRVVLDA